jgi:hypothetical protein
MDVFVLFSVETSNAEVLNFSLITLSSSFHRRTNRSTLLLQASLKFKNMASTTSSQPHGEGASGPCARGASHPHLGQASQPYAIEATEAHALGQTTPRPGGRIESHGEGPSQSQRPVPPQPGSQAPSSSEKWNEAHLELLLDLWEETYFDFNRSSLSMRNWEEILQKLMAGFPRQVNRTWKASRDKIAKMKTLYKNQKALAGQSGAPVPDLKFFGRFDFILSRTAKVSGISSGIDQGVSSHMSKLWTSRSQFPVGEQRACSQG